MPLAAVAWMVGRQGRYQRFATGALFIVAALALGVLAPRIAWPELACPFPLFLVAAGAVLGFGLLRPNPADSEKVRLRIRQLSLIVLALAMLGKMALRVRISHYGFVLAIPAMMLVVVALLIWIPMAIDRFRGAGVVFASASLGLLGAVLVVEMMRQKPFVANKTYWLGQGADEFRTDVRGWYVNQALDYIATEFPPRATMAVLPEGIMLNYLSRRVNPTPYTNCIPTEVKFFGEDNILASLQAHPPEVIVIIHKDTAQFGLQYFGKDYAQDIGQWVSRHYEPARLIGEVPLQSHTRFGIAVLKRQTRSAPEGGPDHR